MALVKCSECGHDVSTLAIACPNCGAPGPEAAGRRGDPETHIAQPKPAGRGIGRPAIRLTLYALLCLVVLVAMVLVGRTLALQSDATPATGYLSWRSDPGEKVGIFGEDHQTLPADLAEVQRWAARGEACLAEPGTRAKVVQGRHPLWTSVSVEAQSGRCSGYRGWVPIAAWHSSTP